MTIFKQGLQRRIASTPFLSLVSAAPFALLPPAVFAQPALEDCLREEVVKLSNASRTVAELRSFCSASANDDIPIAVSPSVVANPTTVRPTLALEDMRNSFFQPYKKNYITFGSLENRAGGKPFSGQTLDIKFELGMQFSLFGRTDDFTALAPLKFGYSQRSWWDIAESSAPFKEHNYNPEVFWDFTEALAQPSDHTRLHLFDLAGFEHQSNGLDGTRSRSWDRLYVQRELRISEMLGWTIKAWDVVNLGDFNLDIEDYLGNVELTTHFEFNNWVGVDIRTLKGRKTEKVSYQADVILPMSRWVNSRFVLSYYEGYGEALISYNQKTKSLRAGFYFPLGF
ncbi:MAG: phospholipase A [Pseudomonadota bacterium]